MAAIKSLDIPLQSSIVIPFAINLATISDWTILLFLLPQSRILSASLRFLPVPALQIQVQVPWLDCKLFSGSSNTILHQYHVIRTRAFCFDHCCSTLLQLGSTSEEWSRSWCHLCCQVYGHIFSAFWNPQLSKKIYWHCILYGLCRVRRHY